MVDMPLGQKSASVPENVTTIGDRLTKGSTGNPVVTCLLRVLAELEEEERATHTVWQATGIE